MNFINNVSTIVDDIQLENGYDKEIIKYRFLEEVSYYEKKREKTKKYYNSFRFVVTSGSILLPAILSMGQMDPEKLPKNFDQVTYWATWLISLAVTGCNGFLQLFKLDKDYYSYSMVVEQLKTEGWQFFGLSGKYEDFETHQQAYKSFSKSIESIKRKQIEQEFSNGKGENKKKKFDFHKEMKQFQTNAIDSSDNLKNKIQTELVSKPSSLLSKTINDLQQEAVSNVVTTVKGQLSETMSDKVIPPLVPDSESGKKETIEENNPPEKSPKP
jgi:hypothetical protein